ncbi:MAG: HAD-IA family hydrolase [Burkholderiales bacterium]|nr:HAD-IA family hydrolase [Burkholderiales bacterium]
MKSRKYDLLVFDWDGTLIDSAATIVACLKAASCDLDLPEPTDQSARHVIGLGLDEALAHLWPGLLPESGRALVERYRHYFLSRDHDIPLFPHVSDGIKGLYEDGFLLAVATGKSRRGLDRSLEATGLASYFHGTRCADESFSKPHPGMLLDLMGALGTRPGRTLMIGDTTHDLKMAENARVASLAVSYGAHAEQGLLAHSALGCMRDFAEVSAWLTANA